MSPRTAQRAPKGRDRDRADRRTVVDVLLARATRGVMSSTEGALLAEHVREEQRLADENRRALAGTTQALERHRKAADAAIREAEQRAEQAEHRVEQVEERLAAYVDAFGPEAVEDSHAMQHRAATAEAAVSRVRVLAQQMRAGSPQGAAAIYADRIEQALDNDRRALDPDTAIRAQFLAAADSTTARLAEKQRDHDIALATARRNTVAAAEEAREQRRRAGRYRLAWLAARRDRKADRAAMAADLATMRAAEQQLAALRAALPDEPRPCLGLPNDLAYANGRHDLAECVRYALDHAGRT
ncbi:hypothetical protein [Streptomyces sp. NPDC092370]|uniref:hypothetical protein n=1 Tax=Streptomyces sp. NPDC092370 TaxID=3366016 RepID=UPI0038109474